VHAGVVPTETEASEATGGATSSARRDATLVARTVADIHTRGLPKADVSEISLQMRW